MAQKETGLRRKSSYAKRAKETQVHIERIRAMLRAPERGQAIPNENA
jgi:hypothetical protein